MREFDGTLDSYAFTTEVAKLSDLPKESEIIKANGRMFRVEKVLPGPTHDDPTTPLPVCLHVKEVSNESVEQAEKYNEAVYSQFKTEFATTILCPGGGQYYILPYRKAHGLKATDDVVINGKHREVSWVGSGVGPEGEPIVCIKAKGSYVDAPYEETHPHFVFLVRDKEGRQYQIGSFEDVVSKDHDFLLSRRSA